MSDWKVGQYLKNKYTKFPINVRYTGNANIETLFVGQSEDGRKFIFIRDHFEPIVKDKPKLKDKKIIIII